MKNRCRLCDAPPHLHNLQLPDKHDDGCPRGAPPPDRLTLKPGHEEEDHDHLILDGEEVIRVDYGEVDQRGRGVGSPGPVEIKKLLRAVNAAFRKETR